MPDEPRPKSVNMNLEFSSELDGVSKLIELLLFAQNLADTLEYPLISIHLNESIEAARFKILELPARP